MEAFSLLKYWRGGSSLILSSAEPTLKSTATNVVTQNLTETAADDDDGPFFDLEFALADDENDEKESNGGCNSDENNDSECDDDDGEFNFTLSSDCSSNDHNLPVSPSDDLFFKGRLVPIEPSSVLVSDSSTELSNNTNPKSQFPVSFLKSATKFRVFMSGFKKSKQANATRESVASTCVTSPKQQPSTPPAEKQKQEEKEKQSKFLTVKLKVEQVPIVSLFTRDNSNKSQNANNGDETVSASDEKRFSKDVMQKYIKKVKPLYVRVSKRYAEKLKFSGQLSLASGGKQSPPSAAVTPQKSPPPMVVAEKKQPAETEVTEAAPAAIVSNVKNLKQAGLRVVCKHLGKSRSASAAVQSSPPASSRRRDDSLLQQQDGIQSAILHCKRSFNASRDTESSLLSRSVSDPLHDKSLDKSRKSSDLTIKSA